MAKRSFVRVFDGIVSVVLASSVGTVACGGNTASVGASSGATSTSSSGGSSSGEASSSSSSTSSGNPTENLCEVTLSEMLAAASPTKPADFIEVRQSTKKDGDAYTVLGTRGTACGGAKDAATCNAALAKLKLTTDNAGWGDGGRGNGPPEMAARRFAVYSRGDEVGILETATAFGGFFAPIDTAADARLVLHTHGFGLSCTTDPPSTLARNADGSYEAVLIDSGCGTYEFKVKVKTDGTSEVLAQKTISPNACGRRPEGLETASPASVGDLGAYFAEVAHLEAASIVAFERLEAELRTLGAPRSLIAGAATARNDEIRHAGETALLARRFGGKKKPVRIAPPRRRSNAEIALENAVEGCVRETYGALVAAWQARTAKDPDIKSAFTRIAVDEARHADLSWAVARWLEPRLTADERATIEEARHAALDALLDEANVAPTDELVEMAGLPDVPTAKRLVTELQRELSRAAAA